MTAGPAIFQVTSDSPLPLPLVIAHYHLANTNTNTTCPIKKIFQIATLPFCPESPKYLLLDKDDEHGAEEGLIIQHNQNESDTVDVFSSAMAEGNHRGSRRNGRDEARTRVNEARSKG